MIIEYPGYLVNGVYIMPDQIAVHQKDLNYKGFVFDGENYNVYIDEELPGEQL
jgi:hypothetical protein